MHQVIKRNNMHSFCCTCLKEFQHSNELTYNIKEMDLQIRQWLQDDSTIHPNTNSDNFPISVCQECYSKLEDFLKFHRMCLKSLQVFNNILKTSKNGLDTGKMWRPSVRDSKDITLDVGQDDEGNGGDDDIAEEVTEVNCDWLHFDVIDIRKWQAGQHNMSYNKKEEVR